jgi:hypothetical protein
LCLDLDELYLKIRKARCKQKKIVGSKADDTALVQSFRKRQREIERLLNAEQADPKTYDPLLNSLLPPKPQPLKPRPITPVPAVPLKSQPTPAAKSPK